MSDKVHLMTPLMPERAEYLQDIALDVIQKSAALAGRQHTRTIETLQKFLRIINSYYSNLIEGHNTHPYDIVRAMQKEYDVESAKRDLQIESVAHITAQGYMEENLKNDPKLNVTGREFLCFLHQKFYMHLPDGFRVVKDEKTGRESLVAPGMLRTEPVIVGRHRPPDHDSVLTLMERFSSAYALEKYHGALKLVAAAAAHHRLMWIHPFLDGNGRVARLFTEAYLHRIPVKGFGLWSVSRGFARKSDEYKFCLAGADALRRNDLDGRGNLSNEGLVGFCRFFLDACLDQIEYMDRLLQLDDLMDRIRKYIEIRSAGVIPTPIGKSALRIESARMLQEALIKGEVARGAVITASGLKERTGRTLLGQLIDEGLLVSDSPKGDVRMGFPVHAAGWFFPELYPASAK